jgi:hypothetical protein
MGFIEEIPEVEPPAAGEKLHEGATVRVLGLKAAPQHNGVEGELLRFIAEAGRWEVQLSTGSAVKVKPSNLTFVRAKRVFCFAPKIGSAAARAAQARSNAQEQDCSPTCSMEHLSVEGQDVPRAVSEELLQDAFEQVIGELGPQLRKQLGTMEPQFVLLFFGEHCGRSCCCGDNADVDLVEGKHNEV